MRRLTTVFVLSMLVALAQTLTPAAAEAPLANVDAALLARFREGGIVSRVDATNRVLIIGDGTTEISPAVRVYASSGRPSSVGALRRGMPIVFNWRWPDPKLTPVVTEILILPERRS